MNRDKQRKARWAKQTRKKFPSSRFNVEFSEIPLSSVSSGTHYKAIIQEKNKKKTKPAFWKHSGLITAHNGKLLNKKGHMT